MHSAPFLLKVQHQATLIYTVKSQARGHLCRAGDCDCKEVLRGLCSAGKALFLDVSEGYRCTGVVRIDPAVHYDMYTFLYLDYTLVKDNPEQRNLLF